MAPLSDPVRLAAYRDALNNWSFDGYIQFELSEEAYNWVRRELDSVTMKEIGRLMHEFVGNGGAIDEVVERRPEWSGDYEYHHDLRLTIQDTSVYIETRLNYRIPFEPDEPWILVVNIHAP